MPDQEDETGLAPEETFRVLGNETRLDVLRVLSEALRDNEEALSFTALRERVGVADEGNFDYHLNQLRDTFIRRTEAGYTLRMRALDLVGTVLAGTLTDNWREASVVSGTCLFCDAPLTAEYAEGMLSVRCTHGHAVMANLCPPGKAENRDLDYLVSLADHLTRQQLELAIKGICSNCYGQMTPRIEEGELMEYRFHASCEQCGMKYMTTVGMALARHPAVVAFYHDHGRDIAAERLWTLALAQPDNIECISATPARFLVQVVLDTETLELTIDERGAITEIERTDDSDD